MTDNTVVIFNNPQHGYLSVLYPSYTCGLTLQQIIDKDVPSNDYIIIDSNLLPKVSYLFDSLRINNQEIVIDRVKAEELVRNKWRKIRSTIFPKLDVMFMKALEIGDTSLIQEIAYKKETLRNVTAINISEWAEGDTIESYSQRLFEFIPECLTW